MLSGNERFAIDPGSQVSGKLAKTVGIAENPCAPYPLSLSR